MDFKDKVVVSRWVKLKHYQMIGRVDTCRITLQGEGISRFHASIVENSNGWILKDEHSTNGVFVNGKKNRGSGPKKRRYHSSQSKTSYDIQSEDTQ